MKLLPELQKSVDNKASTGISFWGQNQASSPQGLYGMMNKQPTLKRVLRMNELIKTLEQYKVCIMPDEDVLKTNKEE